MREPRGRLSRVTRTAAFLALVSAAALYSEITPRAFNYVIDVNGTYWGIQDADSPRVDTGSIRATQVAPGGSTGAYSTAINGFGGIRVRVQTAPEPYLNGELMRGFGLRFDGVNRFRTTQSIDLGGVTISRSVYINTGANWGRWLDTFTNDTKSPITLLELGLMARSGKLVVACPDGFWRRGNLEVVCARYQVPLVSGLDELLAHVRARLIRTGTGS